MGKGVPVKRRRENPPMPFRGKQALQKPQRLTMKDRQLQWTMAGLKALHAPMVGRLKA